MLCRTFGMAIALAIWVAPAGAAIQHEQSDETIPLKGAKTLRVDNARGEIDVRVGAQGRLRVKALKTVRAATEERARSLAAETQVEMGRSGDTFEIRVRYAQRGPIHIGWGDLFRGELETPDAEVQLELEIPAGMALDVRAASADIATHGLGGPQTLDAASGDVTVESSRGEVGVTTASGSVDARDTDAFAVRTASGSIDVDGAAGALNLRTASGDITVRNARDSIAVRTVSGEIRVAAAPRGLTANTSSGRITADGVAHRAMLSAASGSVDVSFVAPLTSARVGTVSGRISGQIAENVGCRLEMRTSGGNLEVRVPFELQSVSRREITGVVKGGKAPLLLESSAGDIELSSGGI